VHSDQQEHPPRKSICTGKHKNGGEQDRDSNTAEKIPRGKGTASNRTAMMKLSGNRCPWTAERDRRRPEHSTRERQLQSKMTELGNDKDSQKTERLGPTNETKTGSENRANQERARESLTHETVDHRTERETTSGVIGTWTSTRE
jgi:hypothetical protein